MLSFAAAPRPLTILAPRNEPYDVVTACHICRQDANDGANQRRGTTAKYVAEGYDD